MTPRHAPAPVAATGGNAAESLVGGERGRCHQKAKNRTGGSLPALVASKYGWVAARPIPAAAPASCCGGGSCGEERRRRPLPPNPSQRHQKDMSPIASAPCPVASPLPPPEKRPKKKAAARPRP